MLKLATLFLLLLGFFGCIVVLGVLLQMLAKEIHETMVLLLESEPCNWTSEGEDGDEI